MKFLTRQALASAFLILCSAFFTLKSQTIEKKTPTSSVSGTVTMKEKGVAGMTIVLRVPYGGPSTANNAKTDQEGRYRITGVSPGTYEVRPDSTVFAAYTRSSSSTLIIGEGESIEAINICASSWLVG